MSRAAVLASGRGRRQAFGGVLGVHRFFDQCRADPAFTTHDVSNRQDWDWVNWIWTSYSEAERAQILEAPITRAAVRYNPRVDDPNAHDHHRRGMQDTGPETGQEGGPRREHGEAVL